MYLVVALVLAIFGLIGLADVYCSGSKGAATLSGMLFTAAVCAVLWHIADAPLSALSAIVIAGSILALTLPPELRKFARKRAAVLEARKAMTTEQ